MEKTIKILDFLIYWSIVLIPFQMAIAPAPMNVFMGFLIIAFLHKKILKKEFVFQKSAISMPLLFFFIITCVSLINSINLADSLKGGILRLVQYIFVLFAVSQNLKDKKHIFLLLISIAAGLLLASIDGIWQIKTGHDFIRGYAPVVNLGLVRATAAFKDSNLLGIYLSALSPLVFGLTLYYFKGRNKIIAVLISIISLGGILLTYSRPTLLAIYIVLFFFGIVRKDKLLIMILIILTLAAPFLLPASIKNWAKEVEYNPLRFMCNDDRIAAYRNSMHMIKAHPVIGLGANTYMKNYKQYKEFPEYRNVVTLDYMYAHNMYLQMAVELGITGLVIFIWLLFMLFKECARIYSALNDSFLKDISLSLTACLIAFLVNGLTESSLYYSRVAMVFWFLAGLCLSLGKFINANKVKA